MGGSLGGWATQGAIQAANNMDAAKKNKLDDKAASMAYKPKQEPVVKRKGRKETPKRDNLRLTT